MLKFFFKSKVHLKSSQNEVYRNLGKFFTTDKSDSNRKKEVFILKAQPKKPEAKPLKATPSEEAPIKSTIPKDEKAEMKTLKSKEEAKIMKMKKPESELKPKEIPVYKKEKSIYPGYFTHNRYYSKYVKNLEKSATNYFDKIYGKVFNELIRNKIQNLEKNLNEFRKKSSEEFDNKVQNIRIESKTPAEANKLKEELSSASQSNQHEHLEIFKSSSISEMESKLKNIPILILNDFAFKAKILDFFCERNVDKAFEFFYDNMRFDSLDLTNAGKFSNFLEKLLKYDKVEYLKVVYETFAKNQVNTSKLTDPMFNFVESFSDFLNYHTRVNLDYNNALVGLKFVFYQLKNSEKISTDAKFNESISEIFDKLSEIEFKSRKLVENKSLIDLIKDYSQIINKIEQLELKMINNPFLLKEESLAKILSLTFDNSNELKELDILQIILDISQKQENLLKYLSENVTAYYQLFGFAPKIISGKRLKQKYHELRASLQSKDGKAPVLNAPLLEFFLLLFKYNSMPEYSGDCIRHWNDFLGVANSKKSSNLKLYESCLSDFILNSEIENEHFYHKNIEKVFKERNKTVSPHLNVDYLVFKTLSYLKDGNIDFAAEDFLKNLDANVKNAKDSDKELVNFYNQMFEEKSDASSKVEIDPEVEFEFTLRKVNLIENLRQNVTGLFANLTENEANNKFRTKENFVQLLKNTEILDSNQHSDQLKRRLVVNITRDLENLQNLSLESIKLEHKQRKSEEEEMNIETLENIYAKIKVELYQDDYKYQLLSNMLNRNIIHVSDINNIELNEKEKQSTLHNLERSLSSITDKNYLKFAKLVIKFFRLKPAAFRRNEFISEEDIYKTKSTQEKYVAVQKLKSDFLREIIASKPSIQEIIPRYESLLKETKQNSKSSDVVIEAKTEATLKNFLSAYNFANLDEIEVTRKFHKLNRKISKIVDKASFYKLITLNKIKDNRARNIIKAIYNHNNKYSKNTPIASTAVYISDLIEKRNLSKFLNRNDSVPILKSLNEMSNVAIGRKDKVYIESIIEEIFKMKNISSEKQLDFSKNKSVTTMAKVDKMKELLNQEYEIFTPKHAIYMILYGIENNMPFAIRLAEKACSDLGYVLPSWVELRLNKYLLSNSKAYAATVTKIGPVNVANVYRSEIAKEKTHDDRGIESLYDNYKAGSIYAVDYLPFKGLEQIVDLKKFAMIMKNVGMKI